VIVIHDLTHNAYYTDKLIQHWDMKQMKPPVSLMMCI